MGAGGEEETSSNTERAILKAEELMAGQWFELNARRMLACRRDSDRYWCYSLGGLVSINFCAEVELLEGCDGWEWVKPEPPKPEPQYRPFANAEEFAPHRDRWLMHTSGSYWAKIGVYGDHQVRTTVDGRGLTWSQLLDGYVFDDTGLPFGVEVGSDA